MCEYLIFMYARIHVCVYIYISIHVRICWLSIVHALANDPACHDFLMSPLYWVLEPGCSILAFVWSFRSLCMRQAARAARTMFSHGRCKVYV